MTSYADYLLSDHWRMLRQSKLVQTPCCEHCGRGLFLQVHHHRYRHPLTSCTIDDVQTLCRFCHADLHQVDPEISTAWAAKEARKYWNQADEKRAVPLPAQHGGRPKKRELEAARAAERRRLMALDAKRSNSAYIIFPEDRLFHNIPQAVRPGYCHSSSRKAASSIVGALPEQGGEGTVKTRDERWLKQNLRRPTVSKSRRHGLTG
jgi:hypothetical protein